CVTHVGLRSRAPWLRASVSSYRTGATPAPECRPPGLAARASGPTMPPMGSRIAADSRRLASSPNRLSPASDGPGATRPPRHRRRARFTLSQDNSMGKKLYVGNLSFDVDSSALEGMFAGFGTVQSAQVIMDRDTGRSKGFGFVEMGSDAEAQAAIAAMHGK